MHRPWHRGPGGPRRVAWMRRRVPRMPRRVARITKRFGRATLCRPPCADANSSSAHANAAVHSLRAYSTSASACTSRASVAVAFSSAELTAAPHSAIAVRNPTASTSGCCRAAALTSPSAVMSVRRHRRAASSGSACISKFDSSARFRCNEGPPPASFIAHFLGRNEPSPTFTIISLIQSQQGSAGEHGGRDRPIPPVRSHRGFAERDRGSQ